ncbi:hypothetical protein NUW54_g6489 [Trametes sanguinea]|uniref:Uncharacterized protein n=1 Tax=Trametes sanguinea TaxID=158606 RepID=A0ACC1PS71_9APHY|nr:hypothetical protein NUW54_g6489 [Trametes sanguinea]
MAPARILPSLQELEFPRVRFESDDHFVDTLKVLHLFTDISELEFWAGLVWWSDPADVLKGLRWPGSAKVQTLAFVDFPNGWTSITHQAITQSGSLDGARTPWPSVPKAMWTRSSLYSLSYKQSHLVYAGCASIRFLPTSISHLGLSLIVEMYSHNSPTDVDHLVSNIQFRSYIRLLGRCTSIGLEHVVLDVRNTDHDFMLELDWDDMDRQLSDIGSLRSVRVDYNEMTEI